MVGGASQNLSDLVGMKPRCFRGPEQSRVDEESAQGCILEISRMNRLKILQTKPPVLLKVHRYPMD